MSETTSFALIGCGRVAERHIEAIAASPHARLAAVCDIDAAAARAHGELGGVPHFTGHHAMLERVPEIDVVSINTPSGLHFDQACDVITRHGKALLIEKPMVMTLSQGAELKRLAAAAGVALYPIYQSRCNKAVRRVKRALDAGELGAPRVGAVRLRWCRDESYYSLSPWRGTYAMDGGALTNQGIHHIDLLRHLLGEVKRVCAKLTTLGVEIEVEDTAVAALEFESGALGVLEIMTSARPVDFEAAVSCVCERGLAEIGGTAVNALTVFSPDPDECPAHSERFPTVYGFGHDTVIEQAALAFQGLGEPVIAYDDGLATIRLLHALYRSDEIGGWVEVAGTGDSERLGRPDPALAALYEASS